MLVVVVATTVTKMMPHERSVCHSCRGRYTAVPWMSEPTKASTTMTMIGCPTFSSFCLFLETSMTTQLCLERVPLQASPVHWLLYPHSMARSSTRTERGWNRIGKQQCVVEYRLNRTSQKRTRSRGSRHLYPCKREEASILHVVGEPDKTQSTDQASHPQLLGRRALVVASINTVPTQEHYVADSLS